MAGKVCSRVSTQEIVHTHMLAQLVCFGRRTITGLITTAGLQFQDWTANYALYAKDRVKPKELFRMIRREIEQLNAPEQPLVVAIDDTILRKTGRHIPGAAYRKDPLSPAFNINLIWAQRMIQYSAAVPGPNGDVRMIPIAFQNASTPRKPRKNATTEEIADYKEKMKQKNLNALAIITLEQIQKERTHEGKSAPTLHSVVDGSYTNRKILRNIPKGVVVIGRIRQDARLNAKPVNQPECGRKKIYGDALPTPKEIRQDETIPYEDMPVRIGGNDHTLRIKTIERVRWRAAGALDLRLIIIAPVPYHTNPNGKRRYRQPAYLICTDPTIPVKQVVQEYIWRWDIEVNHRDEKTLLGVGQAQVRNKNSAFTIPAVAVAAYSMLHLAAIKAYGWTGCAGVIPPPKWHDPKKKIRASTQDLMNELRREIWSDNLTDFANNPPSDMKSQKCNLNLYSAVFSGAA